MGTSAATAPVIEKNLKLFDALDLHGLSNRTFKWWKDYKYIAYTARFQSSCTDIHHISSMAMLAVNCHFFGLKRTATAIILANPAMQVSRAPAMGGCYEGSPIRWLPRYYTPPGEPCGAQCIARQSSPVTRRDKAPFDHSATYNKPNALSPCILMPQWMVRKAREISLRAATVPVEAGCR